MHVVVLFNLLLDKEFLVISIFLKNMYEYACAPLIFMVPSEARRGC